MSLSRDVSPCPFLQLGYSVVFCGLARGNVTACRTYFCVLPAVTFSRALEREEKRRLKAAEPEDVTAAVLA
ncbi:hypothetical protein NDU88_010894 [Pleurodeles waltl]|uniref:Uncharacterized protein n=1 Tax=Pleurodeles waltl TaxID=8319 RepID=A0AAV7QZK8_PLEWA|nr:hypothetical protein NDU88_010894 [Pleurodeles waltl]